MILLPKVPPLSAIQNKHPTNPLTKAFTDDLAVRNQDYDTNVKNYDTAKRLYKVNDTYYYRRRIKQKLIRISLRTKNIKIALKRKRILNLMGAEQMFKLETADFKLMFEYDTEEELRVALEQVKEMQIQSQLERFKATKEHLKQIDKINSDLTFEMLRDKFIYRKKQDNIVSEASLGAYQTAFKILIDFFKNRFIEEITIEDFEELKDSLVKKRDRKNKTINKHLSYAKNFIEFAHERNLISQNNIKALTMLDETEDAKKRKQELKKYTNQQINNILEFEYDDPIFNKIMLVAVYTGMRINEINSLEEEDIKQDEETGIYYFNITESKSVAGVRKIPIHKNIIDMVLSTTFPLLENLTINAFGKKVRNQLYKVVEKGKYNFHMLRAKFIQNAVNATIEQKNYLIVIQEIVGHAKGEARITFDNYVGEFDLKLSKKIMDMINYDY